ncbi:hypothetical protein [Acinetobacter nosocomialis]|uniref:hypothetical protein n=1 Tax=Acinetobacter nosocomialis TaxID=106654 RepID=UPI0032B3FED1
MELTQNNLQALTISYIPSEISFGDTLIFLLIFAAFSIVYTAFCMMLFFFGISLLPVTYFILSVVDRYLPSHIKIGEKLPFPKISIITLGVSVYLLYIIRGLFFLDWKINAYIGITISLISFSYYAFYVNQKRVKEYRLKFENLREIIDDPKASKNLKNFAETKLKQLEIWIKNSIQSALFLILTPLIFMSLIEDVGKIFLYYTMEKTGVRIEKATLYIKEPYANLIELPQTTDPSQNNGQYFPLKIT